MIHLSIKLCIHYVKFNRQVYYNLHLKLKSDKIEIVL